MKLISFVLVSFVFSAVALADVVVPPTAFISAHVVYDCPEGPGWMRIVTVNVYGEKLSRNVFTGSRKDCLAQATGLRRTRGVIYSPTLIAVCSAAPHYMVRWQINEWGQLVPLPHEYYKEKQECLADAAATNG